MVNEKKNKKLQKVFLLFLMTLCVPYSCNLSLNMNRGTGYRASTVEVDINQVEEKIEELEGQLEKFSGDRRASIKQLLETEYLKRDIYYLAQEKNFQEARKTLDKKIVSARLAGRVQLENTARGLKKQVISAKIDDEVQNMSFSAKEKTALQEDIHQYLKRVNNWELLKPFSLKKYSLVYVYLIQQEKYEDARVVTMEQLKRAREINNQIETDVYEAYQANHTNRVQARGRLYQEVLESEKSFQKYFQTYYEEKNPGTYDGAMDMVNSAQRYAREKGLGNASQFLEKYENKILAARLNYQSNRDLDRLTNDKKAFEHAFHQRLEVDPDKKYKNTREFIDSCQQYARFAKTKMPPEDFNLYQKMIDAKLKHQQSIAALDSMISNSDTTALSRLKVDTLPSDSLNPNGVFKFHRYILVITYISIQQSDKRIQRGRAVHEASRVLVRYVDKNIDESKKNRMVAGGKLAPYLIEGRPSNYFPTGRQDKKGNPVVQYRVAFSMVRDEEFTQELFDKHLSPVDFDEAYYREFFTGYKNTN